VFGGYWAGVDNILTAISFSGCGRHDGPELGQVKGTVLLDGQPLSHALLIFQPQGGSGSYSVGITDSKGAYRLEYTRSQKGALVGSHEVSISTAIESSTDLDTKENPKMAKERIPPQYNKKTELIREVKEESNTLDFQLESEGFAPK